MILATPGVYDDRRSARNNNAPPNQVFNDLDDEVSIAIMGATGSGKTTFINLVSGSELRIGRGLKSCTHIVQMAEPFMLDGRSIVLIDTPGFDDTTISDTDVLKMIAAFLQSSYEHGKKLAGIIYMHRISDFRMGGISMRNFQMFKKLCGESPLKNVVIVTNMWGEVSPELGEARERELSGDDLFFKPVLTKGAKFTRHKNTTASAREVLRLLIPNRPEVLRIQEELVDEQRDISQTAAAEELNRELMEQARRYKEELRQLEDAMKIAIKEKDEETRKELEEVHERLHKEMERVEADSKRLASEYNEEKARLEAKMQEIVEQAQRDREAAAAENARQLKDYQDRIDRSAAASAAEKAQLEESMKKALDQAKEDSKAAAARYEDQMAKYRQQLENDRNASAADKAALERKMQAVADKANKDNQTAASAYAQKLQDYQQQLANNDKTAAVEKAQMTQRMADMQNKYDEDRRALQRESRRGGGGFFGSIGRALDSIFGF